MAIQTSSFFCLGCFYFVEFSPKKDIYLASICNLCQLNANKDLGWEDDFLNLICYWLKHNLVNWILKMSPQSLLTRGGRQDYDAVFQDKSTVEFRMSAS